MKSRTKNEKDYLTKREKQVLMLIAKGFNNNLIAKELEISWHTAKSHVASILKKLKANDRALAVIVAIKKGFLKLEDIDV